LAQAGVFLQDAGAGKRESAQQGDKRRVFPQSQAALRLKAEHCAAADPERENPAEPRPDLSGQGAAFAAQKEAISAGGQSEPEVFSFRRKKDAEEGVFFGEELFHGS
jgi:hypothetical protein